MNICDYIIETLYLNGIDTYFVITGGAIVPFINSLAKNPKVKYYCFQHEQSAAMMADAYSRIGPNFLLRPNKKRSSSQ